MVELQEEEGLLFTLKDITYLPDTPRMNEPFLVQGKVELFKIPFFAPVWVIVTVEYPEAWWEEIIPIIGAPQVREMAMVLGADFEITFKGGFTREGVFKLTTRLYAGPTMPLDKITLPPFPPVATSETTFIVSGEVPPPEKVWEMVEEIPDIVVEAGPEVALWEMVEEIPDIVVEAGPEVAIWELAEEVYAIVVEAGPEISVWEMVEGVEGIIIGLREAPEFKGTISKKELEYNGLLASIPAYNIPQGERGLVHIRGRNDMAINQKLGVHWIVKDPDGIVVEDYQDWEFGTTGPDDDHHFIGGRFDLNKPGTWTIGISLAMNPSDPIQVASYDGVLCTVIAAPPAEYTLEVTIEPPGAGHVLISPKAISSSDDKFTYPAGEVVTLVATPYSGYEFDHWGGWPPYPGLGSTSSTLNITMDSNWSVIAVFRKVTEPPLPCTPGEEKCIGLDLYVCSSEGKWILKESYSPRCRYYPPPPPECTPGEEKCIGLDLFVCSTEGKWILSESYSPRCRYGY